MMGTIDFIESIVEVQQKIDDYINENEVLDIDIKSESIVKKKAIEYLGLEIPRKHLCINSKGRIAMVKPQCPFCGSFWMMNNGWKRRKMKTITGKEVTIFVQMYLCGDCGKPSPTPLDDLLCAYKHFTKEIISLAVMLHIDCQISTTTTSEIIKFIFDSNVSPDTVGRWAKNIDDFMEDFDISDEISGLSGRIHLDEQQIKLNGEDKWRYALLDGNGKVINEKIQDDRNQDKIKEFVIHSLVDRAEIFDLLNVDDKLIFITDLDNTYDEILDYLKQKIAMKKNVSINKIRILHQLCIFHLFQHITREFKKASGFNPFARKKLPEDLDRLRKELFAVFYHKTKNDARKAFDKIYDKRWEHKKKVRNVIENIDSRWDDYTHYLEDKTIPKTNNLIEQYFRKTHPEKIKKLYKIKKTVESHLRGLGLKNNLRGHVAWLSLIGLYARIFDIVALIGRFL